MDTRNDDRYLSAKEAAAALGVSLPTLYAYTSRGHVQSEPTPGRIRERRYAREDIERVKERREIRRDPSHAVARGLHWGSPVLDSGITLVHEGRLFYRGRDVQKLAATSTLEEVAELLWAAEPAEKDQLFKHPQFLSAADLKRLRACTKDPMALMQMALPLAETADLAAYDLRPAPIRQAGARILQLLASLVAGRSTRMPIHKTLQMAWAPNRGQVAEIIRAALVASADHELNVSTFVARCAASAGSTAYDIVSAALATLKGHRHGGDTERVAALFAEAESVKQKTAGSAARAVIGNRLRRGERLPGFGHPLYPNGDPRAVLLLRLAQASGNLREWRRVESLRSAALDLLRLSPNLDFGLVAIARTHGLPEYAPLVLFALGRSAGWIAHAIEQHAAGNLIRPRARYTGPAPEPISTA